MKEQKFLIVTNPIDVNEWLQKGWEVISVTAQYVSTGSTYYQKGDWAVVLQKQKL